MKFIRNCNNCGTEYEAERKTSLFCSDKCRVAANRRGIVAAGSDCLMLRLQTQFGLFRIKVFENTVRVERQQPLGDNLSFDLAEYENIYNAVDNIWNYNTIYHLMLAYERTAAK